MKNQKNSIELFSSVTGEIINGKQLTASYWAKNIRKTVLFYPTVRKMIKQGYTTFVEISPHPILEHGLNAALKDEDKNNDIYFQH